MLELHTLSPCGVYKPLVRPMSYWTQVAGDYGKIVFILGIIDGYPTHISFLHSTLGYYDSLSVMFMPT